MSTQQAGPPAPPSIQLKYSPWLVLSTLVLGFFMILLDTTIVNVAIPQMSAHLNASLSQILWVLNAYILAFGGLLLLGARAGDLATARHEQSADPPQVARVRADARHAVRAARAGRDQADARFAGAEQVRSGPAHSCFVRERARSIRLPLRLLIPKRKCEQMSGSRKAISSFFSCEMLAPRHAYAAH